MNTKFLLYGLLSAVVLIGLVFNLSSDAPSPDTELSNSQFSEPQASTVASNNSQPSIDMVSTQTMSEDKNAFSDRLAIPQSTIPVNAQNLVSELRSMLDAEKFDEAARYLKTFYENSDQYTNDEKVVLFDLYANLLKDMELNIDAIAVLEDLLGLADVPEAIRLDALKNLGELYNLETEYEKGLAVFRLWTEISSAGDPDVYKGLSYSQYRIGLYEEALASAIEHVLLAEDRIEDVGLDMLMYLNSLAFTTENWTDAEWITKLMIEKYDRPVDWRNLAAVYSRMGNEEARAEVLANAVEAGKIDEDLNLISQ